MQSLKLYFSAVTLAALASLPLAAQQPSQTPSPSSPSQTTPAQPSAGSQSTPAQSGSGSATASPVQSTSNSPEASNMQLRRVTGELEKKLDAKKAKAGDPIVLKTTEEATIGNGVVIPKGSKILGHVVDAAPTGKESPNSKVTLQFDQAQLKGGQTLAILTVLQSVAPASGAESAPMAAPAGGSAATASPGASSGSPAAPSAQPNSPQSAAAQPNAAAQPGMAQGGNASAGNTAPAAGTVVARQGNVSIMTTAIPGVLIGATANGKPFSNAAGVLLGARQNVQLDGGTHMVLAVADAGTKPTNAR
jgi:hypothetical protein